MGNSNLLLHIDFFQIIIGKSIISELCVCTTMSTSTLRASLCKGQEYNPAKEVLLALLLALQGNPS